MSALGAAIATLEGTDPIGVVGRVATLRGLTAVVDDLPLPVGALVRFESAGESGEAPVRGEVVGLESDRAVVMLFGDLSGRRAGDRVVGEQVSPSALVGDSMLGRVVDGLGRPIDGGAVLTGLVPRPLNPRPVGPMSRTPIDAPIRTGVRAIDLMTPMGRGQRMGVFAGPGVGKSTTLGMIARRTEADVNVIALIGERGREVREFIERSLGDEGLKRSVVVVATGDESPLLRVRAAKLACSIAEHFRSAGREVMLMMDSVTRFAHAQRQIGLSVGEPPATKGYTPSVFAQLATLLERAGAVDADARAGADAGGAITGLYTVLVEGDDMTEPVADAARGILDGHLVLSRRLAQRAHYPAIDVLDSVSRVGDAVVDRGHAESRRQVLSLLARYTEVEDLIQIGAYAPGSDPRVDVAIEFRDPIEALLRQSGDEDETFEAARERLVSIAIGSGTRLAQLGPGGPAGGPTDTSGGAS